VDESISTPAEDAVWLCAKEPLHGGKVEILSATIAVTGMAGAGSDLTNAHLLQSKSVDGPRCVAMGQAPMALQSVSVTARADSSPVWPMSIV